MTSQHLTPTDPPPPAARPPYRPPIGIPVERVRTWRDALVSVALHAFIILLLVLPALLPAVLERGPESAGGPGPAGGGGGGTGGTGGKVQERLQYIQVAPAPPAAKPAVQAVTPPVVPPVKPPVVKPPEPKPTTTSLVPKVDVNLDAAKLGVNVASVTAGTGGGSGNDGTSGNGPGTGGGVGAGVGTGRGNSTGPGTGGGNGTIYTPVPVELFIPPMPVPERIKGSELVAVFDVDSTGRVISFDFKPTGDGGYNRRLREVLGSMRWRPATTVAGIPIRAKGTVTYSF